MNKKKSIIAAIAVVVFLLIGATGVFFLTNRQESVIERNVTDIEWYSEEAEEFVITTAQELYDLIVLSKYYNFERQTIKLGNDIVLNKGNAADWGEKAPEVKWFPIEGFSGRFDGQGHSISGVYGRGVETAMGLFANTTKDSRIMNLKLVNSYFEVDGVSPIGSVVANGCGTLERIYSDATVTGNHENAGGIIGAVNDDGTVSATSKTTKITNCWFDGKVLMTSRTGRCAGGIVGRVCGGILNIAHCLNSGVISAESDDSRSVYIGGIMGNLDYVNFSGTVTMDDCLNVGKVETKITKAIGSIAGGTVANTTWNITNTYTTEQSCSQMCSNRSGAVTGGAPMLNTDYISGKDWFRWTTLDYDTYWTVTQDSTPILRCFADEVIDTSKLTKAYDLSWYNEALYDFTITTKEQLYGFALISYTDTFKGKIVKLGNDIVVNKGKASDWAKGKNLPNECWIPIGRLRGFQGVFDGKGHTISGLYGTTSATFAGLFAYTAVNSEVKNVSVKNSYLESTNESSSAIGSIVGRLEGKVDTTYSNAIISSTGGLNGGIAGYKVSTTDAQITNSWFAGTINLKRETSKNAGGIMGRVLGGSISMDNCLFTGTINIGGQKRTANVGGFIGNTSIGTASIKGCLNNGEIVLTESEAMNAVGRVLGQISNSDQVHVTMEDAYFTNKGFKPTTFYYCGGDKPTIKGGAEMKYEEMISGYNGYCTTGLDFSKYWSVVVNKDDTPILKSFAKTSPSVKGLEKTFDKSWYDPGKKSFVLKDAKDLYGLLYLSNSKIDFKGKTITLGNDIQVHKGLATDWAKGENIPESMYNWGAIGRHTAFLGTFDGKGHTISGLYGVANVACHGLFGRVGSGSVIKNVRVTNTYFESTVEESATLGSIAGRLDGSIHTAYSDAIIVSAGASNGGIAGYMYDTSQKQNSITNSWYNGSIHLNGDKSKFTGGIVGRVLDGKLTINNCLFSGTVNIGGPKRAVYVGGFVGQISKGVLIIKNSLNDGEFHITDANAMSLVCRTIGRISNYDTIQVEMKNSYFTKKGDYPDTFYDCPGKKPTIIGCAEAKEVKDIQGYGGYCTTSLDFKNYWAVVVDEDDTPILKSFADTIPSVAKLNKIFDKSWYDPDKKSFELKDAKDLYGLLYLSNSKIDFKDITITLAKDIRVHKGLATDWAKGENIPESMYNWGAIGKHTAFLGTFDGKGHTISGLYGVANAPFHGLFGRVGADGVIKDVRVTNTYFESTVEESATLGSIAGRLDGSVHTVYSDAIIVSAGASNGGIAGYMYDTSQKQATITNSWYNGTIHLNGDKSKFTGGIVGRVIDGKLTIDNCLFSGTVNIGGPKRSVYVGGFVGQISKGLLHIKNSLNDGEFHITEADSMSLVCRTIGRISDYKTIQVVMEDSYFTRKGAYPDTFYDCPGNKPTIIGCAEAKEVKDIQGYGGYCTTSLDFKNYWAVVVDEDDTPILKSFADTVPSVAGLKKNFDKSWYDENATSFVLKDREDLYGFAYLLNSKVNFKGKTVTLKKDITVNTSGTAAEWAAGTATPVYQWSPIGKSIVFEGTFDGKGYTISGLCGVADTSFMGLFGRTGANSEIKNLYLKNSYFESTVTGSAAIGSIVGHSAGDITNVYSDAIIASVGGLNGGIVGYHNNNSTSKISNCWYAGTIYMQGNDSKATGGIVGRNILGELIIDNCLFSGEIQVGGDTKRSACTAGFVGWVADGVTITNSLNSGIIRITESENGMNTTGRVIGEIQNKNNTDVKVTNVYYTTVGDKATYVWYRPASEDKTYLSKLEGEAIQISEKDIMGDRAYYNTDLDYVDYWTTVVDDVATTNLDETGTPVLRGLAAVKNKTPQIPSYADIRWYDKADEEYTITDKDDLYGLAYLVSMGVTFEGKLIELKAKNGVIDLNEGKGTVSDWMADGFDFTTLEQWTPIGAENYEFAGTFDGKNQTIKGMYINATEKGAGLFHAIAVEGTVQNLKIENSYITSTANYVGSVAGTTSGDIINVKSNAVINTSAHFIGGIVGQVWSDTSAKINISGCWYDGKMSVVRNAGGIIALVSRGNVEMTNCLSEGTITKYQGKDQKWVAGLVGRTIGMLNKWDTQSETNVTLALTMTNCLSTGKMERNSNVEVGSIIGQNNRATMTFTNVYATKECYQYVAAGAEPVSVAIGKNTGSTGQPILVNENEIMGERGYYSLKQFDFENIWTTVVDNVNTTDVNETSTPVLRSFALVKNNIPTAPSEGVNINWYDISNDTYLLSDEADLYGFAYLSNKGITFKGKIIQLDKDMYLNGQKDVVATCEANKTDDLKKWTPIGTTEKKFAGTFDGLNHSINGMYISEDEIGAGLFRATAAGSTIQNLKIENSYITSTANYVGSVAGSTSGSIVNVKSEAKIVSDKPFVGGVVGQIWSDDSAKINISGCWYAGNMSVGGNAGGIVAIVSRGDIAITNCLNSGNIQYSVGTSKSSQRRVAGLIGRTLKLSTEWSDTSDKTVTLNLTVTNCLNTGNVRNYSNNAWVGSVIGENNQYVKPTFTNVYATEESYKYKVSNTELIPNTVGRNTKGNIVTISGITSIPESAIKVSATNNVTAADVLATLNSWGFDTTVWTVGTEGTPELKK